MRPAIRTLSIGVAAASLGLAWLAPAQSTPRHAPDRVPVHGPSAPDVVGGFAGAIDTHDRDAVNDAYFRRMAGNLSTAIRWTGSDAGCRAGKPSVKAHQATLESINFVRALGGLAPVTFNRTLSKNAQKAALIMSANDALSHYPPRSWKCWSRAGYNAAGHSNLALSWPTITAGGLVMQYMDDYGESNIAVGHRRWIMNPPSTAMGSGTTSTSNALWVLGPTRASRPNPDFVAWPTAGWFPGPMEPDGRWSLSAGDDSTDFSRARIFVKDAAGDRHAVRKHPVFVGYGKPTVAWEVKGIGERGTFRVTVKRIERAGRAAPFSYSYTVRLFSPSR